MTATISRPYQDQAGRVGSLLGGGATSRRSPRTQAALMPTALLHGRLTIRKPDVCTGSGNVVRQLPPSLLMLSTARPVSYRVV